LFGGAMLVIVGILELIQGWSAIREDEVFVAAPNYVYALDLYTWGWIHVLIGVVAMVVGAAIVKIRRWGLIAGIVIAGISLVSNFLFVPQSTWWAVVMVGLSVALIWAFSAVISENRRLETG
jgi:hypothetical protein